MKFKKLFSFLIVFIKFYHFSMCMDKDQQYSQAKANNELLKIIKIINIHKAPHHAKGLIASNGEKIEIDWSYSAYILGPQRMKIPEPIYFNVQGLELCALKHREKELLFNETTLEQMKGRGLIHFKPIKENKDSSWKSVIVSLDWLPKIPDLKDKDISILINPSSEEIIEKLNSENFEKSKKIIRYLLFDVKAPKVIKKRI